MNSLEQKCCEKCVDRDCVDEIARTKDGTIWSCPCHRGLPLCPVCKEFACQCPTPPQSQEWEKEFEKEFCDGIRPEWIIGTQRSWPLKYFIRSLLASHRLQTLKEVKKAVEEMIDIREEIPAQYDLNLNEADGWNKAARHILTHLTTLENKEL